MMVDAADKPLEKSSKEDDASLQPIPQRSCTTRSDESPIPLPLSPPPWPAKEEKRRQQEKIRLWGTPYAGASPPGKHGQAGTMEAKSKPPGIAFWCCAEAPKDNAAPPTSRSRTMAANSTPPPRHHGRPGGEDQTTTTPRGGSNPYTRRLLRMSHRHSLRPPEQRTTAAPQTALDQP
jgi:hypothetical protein